MTKELLKAESRHTKKKSDIKELRRSGFVPGVLYGHHREPVKVQIDMPHMEKFLQHHGIGSTLHIEVDGKQSMVMIKDIQRAVLKEDLVHIDFQELTAGEKVRVKLPIHFVNREKVEGHSTVFQEIMHEIEVQTLPKNLVEMIDVDVSSMEVGESLKVMDLEVTKNQDYEILSELDHIVATLSHVKAATEETVESETMDAASVPEIKETVEEE